VGADSRYSFGPAQRQRVIRPPTQRLPGGQVPPQNSTPPHVKPVVDVVVDEVEVEVVLELVDVVELVVVLVLLLVVLVLRVVLVVLELVVLLVGLLLVVVLLVELVVGGLLVVLELLLLVVVVDAVDVVELDVDVVLLEVDVVEVLTVLETRVLLLELEALVDAGNGCVVRVVLGLVELGRGRNVDDVVLGSSCGAAGQLDGAAAFRAAKRRGASRFTAPPSKSRQ
jgi:hypothetical protein